MITNKFLPMNIYHIDLVKNL